jgi:hypothetical protein
VVERGAADIVGDHVPADPAFGQMIEHRECPRQAEGRVMADGIRDDKAQSLRHCRHNGNDQCRIEPGPTATQTPCARRQLGGYSSRLIARPPSGGRLVSRGGVAQAAPLLYLSPSRWRPEYSTAYPRLCGRSGGLTLP